MNNCINIPLLDLPISIFKTRLDTEPEGTTTLRRIVSRESNRPLIEAIRAEPDEDRQKEQKDKLRAFSSVSRLRHRKKGTSFDDKIIDQWPMLAGDVDKAENPGIDMAKLKAQISRMAEVVLCAYSVRGGLWFVVRLPDNQTPESLAAHFRYLQKLFGGKKDGVCFGKFGVRLDSSKGGNPTDLRYVSYDPTPYLNENATVLRGTYTPKPKSALGFIRPHNGFTSEDENTVLTRLVRFAESAGVGERHTKLLWSAQKAGGYIAAGRMDEQNAVHALETIASMWPTFSKSQKTIRDGIRYGLLHPVTDESTATYSGADITKPLPVTIVISVADWKPGTILQPNESQLERLSVEPCDTYPPECDTQSSPDDIVTGTPERITPGHDRPLTFFEWQQQYPPFNAMGLASLQRK